MLTAVMRETRCRFLIFESREIEKKSGIDATTNKIRCQAELQSTILCGSWLAEGESVGNCATSPTPLK
jgi:hypothetical protein